MRDILDPADIWVGTPGSAQVASNKRPVALDDFLTVPRDSGPVTVNVLDNDFDPEGGDLALISASAALGTVIAEADNTVTYTPPAGISGFDTVVYEIADDQDQRRTGQINITISAPVLSVTATPGNTLVVESELGPLDITVIDPSNFAGTYSVDTADLQTGPLPLVAPVVSGTPAAGQVLTANDGLWVFETSAGEPVQGWQWRRGGVDIPGAISATYTVQSEDLASGLSVLEIMTDENGTRAVTTQIIAASFSPTADPALIGWWDASDTATITDSAGAVSNWADKAGSVALTQAFEPQKPETGTRSLNGLNVLHCDTAHLEAMRSFPASGDLAFHMVLEIDGVNNAFEAILAVDATNDFQIDAESATQFDGRLNASGIASATSLTGGPFSGPQILSVILDRTSAGVIETYFGNALRGSTGYTVPLDQSAALHIMSNRSKNAWVTGAVAEVIVTGDTTNRADYYSYLSTKWGVT